jgi:hypothetical protein
MVREGMRGADQQQNHIFNYLFPEEVWLISIRTLIVSPRSPGTNRGR